MKLLIPFLALAALAGETLPAQTTLAGIKLAIGPVGSNNVFIWPGHDLYGGAAIGQGNVVQDYHSSALAVGISNTIGSSYSQNSGSAAFGTFNDIGSPGSLAIGYGNSLRYDLDFGSGSNSLVVGQVNALGYLVDGSIVVGFNSGAGRWGGPDWSPYVQPIEATATFGRGLWNQWNHATVVGQYNAGDTDTPMLFVIGNGTDADHRSNALEVRADGTVIICKPGGDLSMGGFTASPTH